MSDVLIKIIDFRITDINHWDSQCAVSMHSLKAVRLPKISKLSFTVYLEFTYHMFAAKQPVTRHTLQTYRADILCSVVGPYAKGNLLD